MKRILLTFGTNEYTNALNRLSKSAFDYFYQILLCNESTIDQLIIEYPLHFKESKGFGWWAWKPYLLKALMENKLKGVSLEYGDQIMYMDACMEFQKDPKGLLDYFDGPFHFFENGQHHYRYCKQYCYDYMNIIPTKTQIQANGAYMIFKKNEKSLAFVNEWLRYCLNLRLINNDLEDPNDEDPDFINHRHDQSILTNLIIRHKLELNPDITQYGSSDPIINHHRQT